MARVTTCWYFLTRATIRAFCLGVTRQQMTAWQRDASSTKARSLSTSGHSCVCPSSPRGCPGLFSCPPRFRHSMEMRRAFRKSRLPRPGSCHASSTTTFCTSARGSFRSDSSSWSWWRAAEGVAVCQPTRHAQHPSPTPGLPEPALTRNSPLTTMAILAWGSDRNNPFFLGCRLLFSQ